jgi:hypothetical protein
MTSKKTGDFVHIDMESGWQPVADYPAGVTQKILADTIDHDAGTGHLTLLMDWQPGAFVDRVLTHDCIEEVWILSGDQEWLDEDDGSIVQHMQANSYVCRPPGIPHGPFRSVNGCRMLVMFYY